MKQNEITKVTNLLDNSGMLTNAGWCRRNLYEYNRENITAPKWRIKEWDFYQVGNDRFMVQICFANISLGAAATATLVDLKTGKRYARSSISIFTQNRYALPRNGDKPHEFHYKKGKTTLDIEVGENLRSIKFGDSKGGGFSADFVMEMLPSHESITIATPFAKEGRFFYTNKINCMPAWGKVVVGEEVFEFSQADTFGVLDWGRGVWPHKNTWYWGNGSAVVDGKLFGFEITWGFGLETNATETALFYDGKCHKLGKVDVKDCPKGRWLKPWVFEEENGRFNLTMTPFFDNVTGMKVAGLIGARCHQVHGYWNGTVVLDDGKVLEINNMYAFCERMENLW